MTHGTIQQQWMENDSAFFQRIVQNIPSSEPPPVSISVHAVRTTPTSQRPTTPVPAVPATNTSIPSDNTDITNQMAYEI
jgi:hypothetical protein